MPLRYGTMHIERMAKGSHDCPEAQSPKGEKRSADVIGNAVKVMRISPAMEAGLADRLWSFEEIVAGMDAIAPKAGRPMTYKKRPIV